MARNGAPPGAAAPCRPSHAQAHVGGDCLLPDGRQAGKVPPDELRAILMRAEIPGVANDTGYSECLRVFETFLAQVRRDAADYAERQWRVAIVARSAVREVVG
jgi:hypothetical protein